MATRVHDAAAREARTQAIGRELFARAKQQHEHLTTLNRWTKQVLQWCLADPQVKAQVLRFIDCLPCLRSPQAIVRHVREYFPTDQLRLPVPLRLGVSLSRPGLITAPAVAFGVHQLVEQVARQFIAGSTTNEAAALIQRMGAQGLLVSFDVLGEQVTSEQEAERYAERYRTVLRSLHGAVTAAPPAGPGREDRPVIHLSLKPSSLSAHLDPLSFEESLERAMARLRPIAELACEVGAALTLDMEQHELRDLTVALAKRLLGEAGVGERIQLGIVVQAYLRDSEPVVAALVEWLQAHRRRLAIRLVKGAYWDSEVAISRQRGWTAPVYLEKWQTDLAFERLTEQLLAHHTLINTEIASHNVRSIAHAMAVAEELGVSSRQLELQFLYGMGDAIQAAVSQLGYPVRIYTPMGELIPGMAYLVRRILENTSNESFLRQDFWTEAQPDELLRTPGPRPAASPAPVAVSSDEPDVSEPLLNAAIREQREQFARALDAVRGELGRTYPLLLGGQEVQTDSTIMSLNPAHPAQAVGRVASAGPPEVQRAVQAAEAAQRRWQMVPPAERADCLQRAARLLQARRWWFAALEVYEVGKPWREADADVVEAIEYLEYYSASMRLLASGRRLPQRPGEWNRYLYQPRGVCAVIAPWNFPLAILTGMASAALVAGNVVILKPAEQSPVIAYHAVRLLHEAGIPTDVLQYVPGLGQEAGETLVRHPAVRLIMFTGSKTVGLGILEAASRVADGQRFVKHVVTEMGGKNAIIIDEDADLDAAIKGVTASAFSYQGQKCSAASRVIVHDAVYERVMERLVGAADGLVVGDPVSPDVDLGPLIDQEALTRVTTAIARGPEAARLLYRSPSARLPKDGYCVGPTVFAEVDPRSPLAQEELFGPVLCAFRVKTFEDALQLANDADYGLTGGVYSRSPSHVEQAVQAFEVGNLYINRPTVGALVGRQPFGGFKLSGLGTKAGGPDYLLQLMVPKTVCESTARHGMPLE